MARISLQWVALFSLAVLICVSGQNCGGTAVVIGPDVSGTYSGTVNMTLKTTGTTEMEMSNDVAFSVVLAANGQPEGLSLPTTVQGLGTAESSAFVVGETSSFDFTSTVGDTTLTMNTTITLQEAEFSSSGFHVLYNIVGDTTYTGGSLDGAAIHTTGTLLYDGTLADNVLSYNGEMTQNSVATGFPESMNMNSGIEVTWTANLTKE